MFDFQLLPIVTVEAAGFHSNLVHHVILHIKCTNKHHYTQLFAAIQYVDSSLVPRNTEMIA